MEMGWIRNKAICLIALLFALLLPFGVPASNVDSLRTLLQRAEDTTRVRLLNELSEAMSNDDSDQAQKYAEEALSLSQSLKFPKGEGDAWFNIGSISYNHGANSKCLDEFAKALNHYKEAGDSLGIQGACNGLGLVHDAMGEVKEALDYYENARIINEKLGNKKGLATTYNNIGALYNNSGNYLKSIEYFKKTLAIDEAGNDLEGMGTSHSNIGIMYINLEQADKAVEEMKQALAIRRRIGSPTLIAHSLNNLGEAYAADSMMEEAEKVYLESLEIKKTLNNDFDLAITLDNLGAFYLSWKKYPVALDYLLQAKKIIDKQARSDIYADNMGHLSKAYAGTGDFEKAYAFEKESHDVADSLSSEDARAEEAKLLALYDNERKEHQLEQYKLDAAKNELQTSRFYLALALLTAGLVILMAGAFIIFIGYRRKTRSNAQLRKLNEDVAEKNKEIEAQRDLLEKQNKQIREINSNLEQLVHDRTADLLTTNRELDTFLYESSHALRRPLLRIVALFDLIRQEKDPKLVEEYNTKVEYTVRTMNNTFRKLIEVNEIGRRTPQLDHISIGELVQSVLRDLGEMYRPQEMSVRWESPNGADFETDRYIFTAVMRNILENALHFHRLEQGVKLEIVTRLTKDSSGITLSIRDNGTGIPSRLYHSIFQMFFRGTENSMGTGLGLFVSKKGVEKLGGTIDVNSVENEFTEIVIRLPYQNK